MTISLNPLRSGDGFQTGHRQFERVSLSSVIAAPDRRSRFRRDLAGQTKLREFGADFNENRALDRCRRRQAMILALCRSAHHHKLCFRKFDTHDPTLPLIPEVRAIRPLTRTSPGSVSADGAVGSRALGAPWGLKVLRTTLRAAERPTHMLGFEPKASPFCADGEPGGASNSR